MTEFQKRKELAINGTCEEFHDRFENLPPAMWTQLREQLKVIMNKNLDQHLKPLVDDLVGGGNGDVSGVDVTKYGSTVSTGKGKGKNSRLVAWDEWKTKNDPKKKYGDKSAWDHWTSEVWGKMGEDEKKTFQDKAQTQKTVISNKTDGQERKKPGINAFKIFQERHRKFYGKDDKFNDPASNSDVGGYSLTQKIWTNAIKKDEKMVAHYEKLKKEIDDGEITLEKGVERLPYIDFEQIKKGGWSYDTLKLVD